MSWFSEGFKNVDRDFAEQILSEKRVQPGRIWLKPGYEKELIFVDDRAFRMSEHRLVLENGSPYWTCCVGSGRRRCSLCEEGFRSSPVTLFTVVDCSGYTDRHGSFHINQSLIFAAKPEVSKVLKSTKDRMGGLTGWKFSVTRETSGGFVSNKSFVEIEQVDFSDFNYPMPFDYEDLFAPLPKDTLEILLGRPWNTKGAGCNSQENIR